MQWQREGELKMTRWTLLRILESRFPDALPRKFVKQIETQGDLEQLQRWFDTALTAENWESFAKTLPRATSYGTRRRTVGEGRSS